MTMHQAASQPNKERHGGPYDCGAGDRWYGRPLDPHMYPGDAGCPSSSCRGPRIEAADMSPADLRDYFEGYLDGEPGKDYGEGNFASDWPASLEDAEREFQRLSETCDDCGRVWDGDVDWPRPGCCDICDKT